MNVTASNVLIRFFFQRGYKQISILVKIQWPNQNTLTRIRFIWNKTVYLNKYLIFSFSILVVKTNVRFPVNPFSEIWGTYVGPALQYNPLWLRFIIFVLILKHGSLQMGDRLLPRTVQIPWKSRRSVRSRRPGISITDQSSALPLYSFWTCTENQIMLSRYPKVVLERVKGWQCSVSSKARMSSQGCPEFYAFPLLHKLDRRWTFTHWHVVYISKKTEPRTFGLTAAACAHVLIEIGGIYWSS